jgi:hypothetical protein
LAIPVRSVAALRDDIEKLARMIARASGEQSITELSRQGAEAELELARIRKVRAATFNSLHDNMPATAVAYDNLNQSLARLDRYERRALSRRKRALRALS